MLDNLFSEIGYMVELGKMLWLSINSFPKKWRWKRNGDEGIIHNFFYHVSHLSPRRFKESSLSTIILLYKQYLNIAKLQLPSHKSQVLKNKLRPHVKNAHILLFLLVKRDVNKSTNTIQLHIKKMVEIQYFQRGKNELFHILSQTLLKETPYFQREKKKYFLYFLNVKKMISLKKTWSKSKHKHLEWASCGAKLPPSDGGGAKSTLTLLLLRPMREDCSTTSLLPSIS